MSVFEALGREWHLSLDAPKCARVREECGVKLAVRPGEEFDLRAITEDPELLPDVLWTLCRDDAQRASVEKDAFIRAIVADVAEDAGRALGEAIINFIPSRLRREQLRAALQQDREVEATGLSIMSARLEQLGKASKAKVETEVNRIIDQTLARLSAATDLPANLASTPTDALGAS